MPESLLLAVLKLSEDAAGRIMEIYSKQDMEVETKEDNSPLTQADMESNQIILSGLKKATPGIPIISEESPNIEFSKRSRHDFIWLVDPLDGTKEFISRNGEFTVNIALVKNGKPVLGVVNAPALGVLWYAVKGKGAFGQKKGGQPEAIRVSDYNTRMPVITGSRSHRSKAMDYFLEQLGEHRFVSAGSSLKLCMVAEGKAHIYPRFGHTMEWDTAAGQAILQEAGGFVTDLQGDTIRYNKENLLNPFFMATGSQAFPWKRFIAPGVTR